MEGCVRQLTVNLLRRDFASVLLLYALFNTYFSTRWILETYGVTLSERSSMYIHTVAGEII